MAFWMLYGYMALWRILNISGHCFFLLTLFHFDYRLLIPIQCTIYMNYELLLINTCAIYISIKMKT